MRCLISAGGTDANTLYDKKQNDALPFLLFLDHFYYSKMEKKRAWPFTTSFQFDPCSLKMGCVSYGVTITATSVPSQAEH